MQPHLLFICTAIGFSWSGFVLIFSGEPSMRPTYAVQSTIATSIFLGSIGFAFADRSILLGGTITFCGMIIAFLLHQRLSYAWSTLIATACFAAYLNGAML